MTMTNVAIIYHSDDLDGHLSGELLKRVNAAAFTCTPSQLVKIILGG